MSYCRVALKTSDGDVLVLYLPLHADGRYDEEGAQPHLVKAMINRNRKASFGELLPEGRIVWGGVDQRSITDLLGQPLTTGRRVVVSSFYDPETPATFIIKEVTPL